MTTRLHSPRRRTGLSLTTLAGVIALAAHSAEAQDSADSAAGDAGASGELAEVIVTAQFREQPLQDTPIAITARSVDSFGVRMAAQRGWGVVSANFVTTRVVAGHWATLQKALAENGKTASGADWRVARNLCVAASEEEARARVFAEAGSNRYYFHYLSTLARKAGQLATLKPSAR